MLKRLQAVVAAVALGSAALLAAPSASAAATAPITNVEVNPSPVVIHSSAKVPVTFSFVTEVGDAGKVSATVGLKGDSPDALSLTKSGTGPYTYKGTLDFDRGCTPGVWEFKVKADDQTSSTEFKVIQVWDTDIAGFGASPEPIKAGEVLALSGKLLIDGPKGWHGYKDQKVVIFFKEAGTYHYKPVAYDYTNWRGEFAVGVKAWKTGWWRAEYDGSEIAHKSVSDADQVDVIWKPKPKPPTDEPETSFDSRVIRFDASPEPVKYGRYLYFSGKLQVWDGGWEGYGEAKVSLWFRTKHGSWKYVKTTWTNDSGKFWTKARAYKSGYWKVVFAGNDEADGSSSRKDWVKVKRW